MWHQWQLQTTEEKAETSELLTLAIIITTSLVLCRCLLYLPISHSSSSPLAKTLTKQTVWIRTNTSTPVWPADSLRSVPRWRPTVQLRTSCNRAPTSGGYTRSAGKRCTLYWSPETPFYVPPTRLHPSACATVMRVILGNTAYPHYKPSSAPIQVTEQYELDNNLKVKQAKLMKKEDTLDTLLSD